MKAGSALPERPAASPQRTASPAPAPAEPAAPSKPDALAPLPAGAGITEVWGAGARARGASRRDRMTVSWLTLKSVDKQRAVVAVQNPSDFHAASSASERLGELFKQAVGAAVEVLVEAPAGQGVSERDLSEQDRAALAHPLVEQAKELFGARVLRVERVERNTTNEANDV